MKIGGSFIPYKSGKVDEELSAGEKAISLLGGKLQVKKDFKLIDSDISRSLLQIHKIKATSKKYPRKSGTPTKEPIC